MESGCECEMRVRAMAETISARQHDTEIVECYVSQAGCSRVDWKAKGLDGEKPT